jgi:hypothetical protein
MLKIDGTASGELTGRTIFSYSSPMHLIMNQKKTFYSPLSTGSNAVSSAFSVASLVKRVMTFR